ncbi:hypothetical protein B0T14DRAFT_94157 [Immersiella caudata]|uniref:Uncharacterized protein n=1 Tax=Immersiella caudata TaxID=314043 RepID=A0AA39X2T6_9PEZI|nr:hypothetical protein B0T14DRAFT_94157 [Immersiella caudata]
MPTARFPPGTYSVLLQVDTPQLLISTLSQAAAMVTDSAATVRQRGREGGHRTGFAECMRNALGVGHDIPSFLLIVEACDSGEFGQSVGVGSGYDLGTGAGGGGFALNPSFGPLWVRTHAKSLLDA